MLQVIEKVNHFIQPILWGWPVLICILLAGILFTVRLRFFSIYKNRFMDETHLCRYVSEKKTKQ